MIFKFLKKKRKEKNEVMSLKEDLKNTEALIDLLRQQGHDHINHIQTVKSMLLLEEYDTAKTYLDGISKSYHFTGFFLRLGNPSLTATVNTKKELANRKGIDFRIEKYCRVKLKELKPWDLTSLISNLIDNAIEYLLDNPDLPQVIYFKMENQDNLKGYRIYIGNSYKGPPINVDKIFQKGYSSKNKVGRGYGLSIVQEIVNNYNGKINVKVEQEMINFEVEVENEHVKCLSS